MHIHRLKTSETGIYVVVVAEDQVHIQVGVVIEARLMLHVSVQANYIVCLNREV